jgi:hypothetical protein
MAFLRNLGDNMSHNKKRNTGFVYEALVRELTKAIVVEKNINKQQKIRSVLKSYFNPDKPLGRELQLYKALQENIEQKYAQRYVDVIKNEYAKLDQAEIEREHSRLINEINKNISSEVFKNYVPNYKDLATIGQIFSSKTSPKEKILLEDTLLNTLTKTTLNEDKVVVDNLVYNTFVKKFNETYGSNLISEQKELLARYITSFADNGLELKIYLNEQLSELKVKLAKLSDSDEFKDNVQLTENIDGVLSYIESLSKKEIVEEDLKKILKVQELVKEVKLND